MDEENIIRNIVKEIVKDCKKEKIDVDNNFCTFYVKLLALDPNWKIFDDILRARNDVQKLIQYVVSKLKETNDSQIYILKTQFYFEYEFEHLIEFTVVNFRRDLRSKLLPLRLSILEVAPANRDNLPKIYEKVVNYITLLTGLGNPTLKEVYREAETALKSFWGPEDVKGFMSNLYTTRSDLLEKIANITAGIRLYNMDCDRGGQGIYNLPEQLEDAVDAVRTRIQMIVEEVLQRVSWLSDIVHKSYRLNNQKYILSLQAYVPTFATDADLEYVKDLLVIYKQYSDILCTLSDQLDTTEMDINHLKHSYTETLLFLHGRIVPNMHIRAAIVFPVFEKLSYLWSEFQDQTIKLKGLANILNKQDSLVRCLKFENPLLTNSLPEYEMPNHIYSRDFSLPIAPEVNVFRKENLKYFSKVKYHFGGHCCWYLALSQGGLAMGNEAHGIIKYKEYFFIFCSPLGLKSFARRPDYYLFRVLDLARRKCELIKYFDIKDYMLQYRHVAKLCEIEVEDIEVADASTCTETHIIPSNIAPHYEWNVWQLKKDALELADCMNKKTKACQTYKSSNLTTDTQTWPPKNNFAQTHCDNYSNTAKPQQFIYGLRGRKDDKQLQLCLTNFELRPLGDKNNNKRMNK